MIFNSSTTWTCPAGVTNIRVECWGAGGGASGNKPLTVGTVIGGSGGGGGSYVRVNSYTPTPGDSYDVNVGIGGSGGTSSLTSPTNGTDGTNTTFVHSASIIAGAAGGHFGTFNSSGGQGGNRSDSGAGYSGGDDAHFGGSGASATSTTFPTLPNGGGGGSSGAFAASGVSASGSTGGVAGSGGGNGGDGIVAAATTANPGFIPGGGGAGASSSSNDGGAGASGQIVLLLTYTISVIDSISISESAIRTYIPTISESILIGESTTTSELDHASYENLSISELVNGQLFLSVSDSLIINENLFRGSSTGDNLTVSELISGTKGYVQSINDAVSISEKLFRDVARVNESLIVSENIVANRIAGVNEFLIVDESLLVQNVFNIHVNETISISEFAINVRTLVTNCQDTFTPTPALGKRATTSLSYPVGVSPTQTVNLRNPKFNNKQELQTGREIRYTRGGDQIINDSPYWLNLTYLEMDFESLNTAQAKGLLTLLEVSAGDQIQLVDWENRTWFGFIVNDPIDVIIQMDSGCEYNASLKFEGVLQ